MDETPVMTGHSPLDGLEEALGYRFRDHSLLMQALVHRSYPHEHPEFVLPSNERLEFLGDAVLGLVIAEHMYHRYPEMKEGELTSVRAAVVKAPSLAQLANALGLGDYLLMSKGEEAHGGRTRVAILACAYEALVGAIFIDGGLEQARRFIVSQFAPVVESVIRGRLDRDHKTELQETVQGLLGITPVYRIVSTTGPDHEPLITVEVTAGEQVLGRGSGRNRREAEQKAAAEALSRMDMGLQRTPPSFVEDEE